MRAHGKMIPSSGGGALVASRIVSTKPINLRSIMVLNTGGAQYIQLFQSATLPANGTVPDLPALSVGAASTTMFDFGENGIDLDALTVCNSSTAASKTLGAADCSIVAIIGG